MSQADQIKKDRQELIDGVTEAVNENRNKTTKSAWWLLFALVGTTLPNQSVSAFFCHFTIICIIYIIFNQSARMSKNITAVAIALGLFSVITGCGSLLSEPNSEIATLCEKRVGTSCGMGVSQGWTVLGWSLNYATIDQAKLDGGISDVFGTEYITGHGLVSVTRIVVYGG